MIRNARRLFFLHYSGSQLCDIYYTLQSVEDEEYKHVKEKLDAYFEPKVNLTFETYNFRQLTQAENESTDKFVTRLGKWLAGVNFMVLHVRLRIKLCKNVLQTDCEERH